MDDMAADIVTGPGSGEAGRWMDRDWLAVAAAMCGQVLSVGTLTLYTLGVFIHPLQTQFGWDRTQLSVAASISSYTIGLSSPLWGVLVDRFGSRVILPPAVVALSALFASLSLLTPHLWHLYLVFFLIALLGPSVVLYPSTLARLFSRHLGLALGLAAMGVGLGATILPPVAQRLISSFGWRDAYLGLGCIALVIGMPVALVATRHVRGPVRRETGLPAVPVLPSVRTRAFILMCAVFVLLGLVTIGTLVHLVPLMTGHGFAPAAAARLAGLTGFAALVSRGVTGWVLDHVQASRLLAAVTLVAVSALLLLDYGTGPAAYYLAVLLLGTALGAEVDVASFMIRRHFPPSLFGRLFGMLFMLFAIGGGTGPIVMGWSFDHLGGYGPGLFLFAAVGVAAAVAALAIPRRDAMRPDRLSGSEA